jgi:hypothetical protein
MKCLTEQHDSVTEVHHVIELLNLGQEVGGSLQVVLVALILKSIPENVIRDRVLR